MTDYPVKDAAKMAGVTYRQLDYWILLGLVPSSGSIGSGHPRTVAAADIPRIAAMGRVSRALRGPSVHVAVPVGLLQAVDAEEGTVDLGEGVALSW
jgi:hypothetical protein